MRIDRLAISGFRGAPLPLELALDGKSVVISGENGFGKSTISDAIEFWSTGDLEAFHRQGCGLDAAANVFATETQVGIRLKGGEVDHPLTRTLNGMEASPLEPDGLTPAEKLPSAAVPLLRHETMRDFMDMRPGEKKKELLELLGLSELNAFRAELRNALTIAKRSREQEAAVADSETGTLERLCEGEELLPTAQRLAREAGISGQLSDPADLLGLRLEAELPKEEPDRLGRIAEAESALQALGEVPVARWNGLLADRGTTGKEALRELLEQAQRALGSWEDDECPLCGQEVNLAKLSEEVTRRLAELARTQRELGQGKRDLQDGTARWQRLADALAELGAITPKGGWGEGGALEGAQLAAAAYAKALRAGAQELREVPDPPALAAERPLAIARTQAEATAGSTRTQALLRLHAIAEQSRRAAAARERVKAARRRERGIERTLEIADDRIEAAINDAISALGELVARYYLTLQRASFYSEVKLTYRRQRGGGIEFSLLFDGEKRISPPQRIASASQLNALGLALFLARIKTAEQPWHTLVLDDVVNSFDAPHRQGLIRLLIDEFPEWQIVLLTHDRSFADIVRATVERGWRFREITHWTPREGPLFAEGDPKERLRERIAVGASASDLGGTARQALESSLSRPVARLGYKVVYDPHRPPTAWELLRALRAGLKENRSELAEDAVLGRIEASNYITNLSVHYRPDRFSPTSDDLQVLLDDLDQLDDLFRCSDCGKAVWASETQKGTHHCGCASLAA